MHIARVTVEPVRVWEMPDEGPQTSAGIELLLCLLVALLATWLCGWPGFAKAGRRDDHAV